MPFKQAEALQAELVSQRQRDEIPDQLLLLEHAPVVTLGRGAKEHFVSSSAEQLHQAGVELHRTGRGGEVTFHGPGQLVAYPIVLLREPERDLHVYLRRLEQVVIDVASRYGLAAERDPGRTGVWLGEKKLASIGIRASRWVTSHGVALNRAHDLTGFRHIVPCGLDGVQMTSLALELDREPSRPEVEGVFCDAWKRVFERDLFEPSS